MKIKFLEVIGESCWTCESGELLLQVTDWEEVTEEEFQKLSEGLSLYNRYTEYSKRRKLILVQQLEITTVKDILSTIEKASKKEQERIRKNKAAAEKRRKTLLENKKKKELQELERLQKKYGG